MLTILRNRIYMEGLRSLNCAGFVSPPLIVPEQSELYSARVGPAIAGPEIDSLIPYGPSASFTVVPTSDAAI